MIVSDFRLLDSDMYVVSGTGRATSLFLRDSRMTLSVDAAVSDRAMNHVGAHTYGTRRERS